MAGEISPLLLDLAVVLVVAAATTILFNVLKQPVVLGYLLAGLIVGPHTPPFAFVHEMETIATLGELGVIFLLFALGLEFNFRKLRKVGATALVAGTLQVALMMWLGYVVGRAFGLDPLGAIFLGAIVSISSTVIIVKAVAELGQQDDEWAQVVFGILIVEDILAVLMLTVLGAAGQAAGFSPMEVASLLGTFALFVATALVVGLLVVPRLMAWVERRGVEEMLVVTAIALGFGLAILGGLLGFSPALGAFVMGALIAESKVHHVVEERILPIRDLFTAIFFVTVGMLVDPAKIVAHWPLIVAVTLAVILGKIVAGSFATFVTGRSVDTSLRAGFGLAQVGEFSFILASLALGLGVTDAPLYAVSVSVAAITAFTTPYLIRRAPSATRALERLAPRPLFTYASLYGAWIRRLTEGGGGHPGRKRATRAAVQAALFGGVTIGLVAGGGASVDAVSHLIAQSAGVRDLPLLVGWLGVGLLALPFALLFARAQRAFAVALTDAALPDAVEASEQGGAVRRVLIHTFTLGGYVLAATLLLLAASPFVPTAPVVAIALLAIGLVAFPLYRALSRFQTYVDEALGGVFGDTTPTPHGREGEREFLDLVRETSPWAVGVREVRVPERGSASALTLRGLDLRGRTGASVVAVHRAGEQILNPSSDAPLLPGDRVVLMGEASQVEAGERLLLESARETPTPERPTVRKVRLREGSPLVGATLKSLRLPDRVGVTVLAIQRGAVRLTNPPPATTLHTDDVLLVLATETQAIHLEEGTLHPEG